MQNAPRSLTDHYNMWPPFLSFMPLYLLLGYLTKYRVLWLPDGRRIALLGCGRVFFSFLLGAMRPLEALVRKKSPKRTSNPLSFGPPIRNLGIGSARDIPCSPIPDNHLGMCKSPR
ncbi:hypothetical protein K443DRAFT_475865 [Laccaria amethystina LaAM-08-1]|uniref:Uncharacterized protein n=1 Tax=Laccaria amethystina LaAM-08-1 TaxID=1095629 RepID=A0A0C9WVD6_9AGAR|nr:hypothetical protein K443DRAFT_475865 [Laccaria amethystina LaAM-08-1]